MNEQVIMQKKEQGDEKMMKEAKKVFDLWAKVLEGGSAEKVASMYTDDATFFPTLNGELKIGKEGAKKYFEHFLQKQPVGKIISSKVAYSDDGQNIVLFGLYDFEVDIDEDGTRETVNAEFTFAFKQKNDSDKWEISHHHSALINKIGELSLPQEIMLDTNTDFEDEFTKVYDETNSDAIEKVVSQKSVDGSMMTFSVLSEKTRSSVVYSKIKDNTWRLVHHQFSPRPE